GGAADALAVYVVTGSALTGGNQTLTITQQAGPFGGGPRSAYKLLAGVKQSGPVRTGSVQADDSPGTSINLSLTSLVAGDQVEWVCGDFGDTSHGAQGNYVAKLDSTANNSESIVCGTFVASGTTASGGPTTGSNIFGA